MTNHEDYEIAAAIYDLPSQSVLDNDPYLDSFSAIQQAGMLSTDDFETLLYRAGRTDGPLLLHVAYTEGHIGLNTVARFVGSVWCGDEHPEDSLDQDEWRELFGVAGYTEDGMPAGRPTDPIKLYRGTIPERQSGWSWTSDLETAQAFASGLRRRPVGKVFEAWVEPDRLLACTTDREESEYVVETEGLMIQEYSPTD